jgi:hypothetical protein
MTITVEPGIMWKACAVFALRDCCVVTEIGACQTRFLAKELVLF